VDDYLSVSCIDVHGSTQTEATCFCANGLRSHFDNLDWSVATSFINIVSWAEIVESISMKTEAVEEAREVGGLALVLLWSVVLAVHGLGKARRSGESSNA
jgi:hypothetical protein